MSSSDAERATIATDPGVLTELGAAALRPIADFHKAWGGDPDDSRVEHAFAEHWAVLDAVAANPDLPRDTALALAKYVPAAIARHPVFRTFDVATLDDSILRHLCSYLDDDQVRRAFDASRAVREHVLDREPPVIDLLVRLAHDGDSYAISRVQSRISDGDVPADLLVSLCADDEWQHAAGAALRAAAAGEHPPSLGALARLSDDWERIQLMKALAGNPCTAPHDLERLFADPETDDIAAKNPSTPAEIIALMDVAHSLYYEASEIAAGAEDERWMDLPDLSAAQIARLETGGPLAREAAGRLPRRAAEDLERLSRSEDVSLRRGVAQNPSASRAILDRLANDDDDEVRDLASANPG